MIFGMTEAQFSNLMFKLLTSGLVCYMFFIIWRLAKDSRAGKFGTAILFFALGFGTVGFIFKETLITLFAPH